MRGLETRNEEPATSPTHVDQLLGGQAEPRSQVSEMALHRVRSNAQHCGRTRNGASSRDIGGQRLALPRGLARFSRHVPGQIVIVRQRAGA